MVPKSANLKSKRRNGVNEKEDFKLFVNGNNDIDHDAGYCVCRTRTTIF